MISRVRIEATAKTEEAVRDDLATGMSVVRTSFAGDWQEGQEQLQTTKDGYWGFQTISRHEP